MGKGNMLPVEVATDRRLRRVHLVIHPQQGLMVRVPIGFPRTEVKKILAQKRQWIASQQARLARLCPWREYRGGELLPLLGGQVPLIRMEGTSYGGYWGEDAVVVQAPGDAHRDRVREVLASLFQHRAKAYFLPRVEVLNQRHFGVALAKVTVRDQQRILGSCSARGNLSLNWRLVMAPAETADYVIIHELAHRLELNHSDRFWQLVEQACPRYREHRNWLRERGVCLCI